MQAIHTEMKKHETFQQNMYNRLHNELQTLYLNLHQFVLLLVLNHQLMT